MRFFIILIVQLLLFSCTSSSNNKELEVNITIESDNLFISVKNNTESKLGLNYYNSVLDTISFTNLELEQNGNYLKRNTEIFIKYKPASSEDLLWLSPNESKKIRVKLAKFISLYDLNKIKNLEHISIISTQKSIRFTKTQDTTRFDSIQIKNLMNPELNPKVIGNLKFYPPIITNDSLNQVITMKRCGVCVRNHMGGCISAHPSNNLTIGYPVSKLQNNSRKKTLIKAVAFIGRMRIRSKMRNNGLFKKWFGTNSASQYNLVRSKLSSTVNFITGCSRFVVYDKSNSCRSDVFAIYAKRWDYNPGKSRCRSYNGRTIHICDQMALCNRFWRSPLKGTDSKIGTLIHEASHGIVKRTTDYAYGKSNCLSLARRSPSKAANNADNYQYYYEELFRF